MTLRLKAGNKYGAKKTTVDGITFHSKQEAKRWVELKLLERAGEIAELERQKPFDLTVNGVRIAKYVADFVYRDNRSTLVIVEDSKGFKTPEYRIKKALMLACHRILVLETGK